MKKYYPILLAFFLLTAGNTVSAQVSGTVFRDFNGNGVKDNGASFNEPFVAGITVTATLASGVSFSTTTDAAGAYSFTVVQIPAASAARIEFSGFAPGDYSALKGTGNSTSVTFVTAPATLVNFALSAPDDYWNNISTPDPVLFTVEGYRATSSGYGNGKFSIIQINNSTAGTQVPANQNVVTIDTSKRPATFGQTGSVFGLAFQKKQQRLFAAAELRRASGLGPQGVGGIYFADKSGANWAFSGGFTLQGVTPANGGAALDFGSVTRVTSPASNNNFIPTDGTTARDNDAFAKAGTMCYGDIEADPNSDSIYMINAFQKSLIVFDGSAASATLNNASAATLAPFTRAYVLSTIPGYPAATGAGNNMRPYAVKIYKGKGYIGVVSDAMSTQSINDLKGYILQFDPTNIAAGFTTVVTVNFNLYSGSFIHPWVTTWAQAGGTATVTVRDYPQPMISSIEFNEDGSMDIGIRDRWGNQGANFEFFPIAGATNTGQTSINGDLLHACYVGGAWILEGTAGSCTQLITEAATATNDVGSATSYGNTGKEWYGDRIGDGGGEDEEGGVAKLMGSGQIVSSVLDPTPSGGSTSGTIYWSTQGIKWNSNSTGLKTHVTRTGGSNNNVDKSNAMGDVEFVSDYQPIQIGNRVWNDTNGDGVQDAGEPSTAFTGTVVTLRSPGIDGIYGNADDQTWTTTVDANGNYYFDNSNVITADNRKPATWTGISGILPGYNYRLEITTPAGFRVTKADAGLNSVDNIDNDATAVGATAIIAVVNTNNVNHSYDFGFKPLGAIGDKVWLDNGAGGGTASDGIQNGTEPGVAGVTVTLYNGSGTVIGTTVTDAYGNYLFDNLPAGTYTVGFTLPDNYTFTQQNTGSGDGAGTATDSDPITTAGATFGRTRTITLAAAQVQLNVDAGIIFKVPAVTQSVGDKVWLDNGGGVPANSGNGVQDANEPGVAGVTVTLYDGTGVAIATTITDANGNYLFTNVPVGSNYRVGFTLPVGMIFTTQSGLVSNTTNSDVNTSGVNFGRSLPFNVLSGDNLTYIDAGILPQPAIKASLGDKVWEDVNHDGVQDPNEPGIAGVTVNLLDASGNPVLLGGLPITTTTDAYGNYMFTNLDAATYIVEFIKPSGYTLSPRNAPTGTLATNSDAYPSGRSGLVPLLAGHRNTSIDAGMYKTAPAGTLKLGDKVWNDYNKDGIQDANEPGVVGATVKLYQNGADGLPGTTDDVLIGTTSTDINGNYIFVNLAASAGASTSYNVQFSNIPAGYSFTTQNSTGSTAANDDDANSNGKTGSINLLADNLTIDAGITQGAPAGKGSLGNKVWYDLNNNGVQDAGELGVGNVTVTLQKDINGDGVFSGVAETAFAVTTTNALGEYMFGDLDAGAYKVVFSNMPLGYVIAIKDAAAGTDETDSDGDNAGVTVIAGTTSTTGVYNLAQGEDNLSVDLGLVQPASRNTLGDFVWFDQNSDGIQTAGEPGVQGVMVTLYNSSGTAIAYTATDANGLYLFTGLADGTYSVGFSNFPAGFDFTTQSGSNDLTGSDASIITGKTTSVTLTYAAGGTSRDNRSLDAGLISTRAALGDKVWLDTNGDGIQDATEKGIAGVTVTLYASDGTTVLATTITDQNGKYLFPNLTAGSYVVGFGTIPGGLEFTQQNTPGDNGNNTNSDANPVTGKSSVIVLSAGEVDLTIDAGVRPKPTATVRDFVWSDLNADGIQDPGEPGIGGIVVTLYNSLNQPIGSAVTDGNGLYIITNVPPGTGYYVIFTNIPTNPSGVQPSFTVQGPPAGTNTSHANASGTTNTFTVNAGDNILNMDAGIKDYPGRSVLPIKLVSFTAAPQGNNVILKWVISEELNVSRYDVEFSSNAINFNSIGNVTATNSRNYSMLHTAPVTGINYYRLRITDRDGNISYSDIRIVNFGKGGTVTIYPSPAKDNINITVTASMINKPATISLVAFDGSIMLQKTINAMSQTERIDLSRVANGKYILRISTDMDVINRPVEVIR